MPVVAHPAGGDHGVGRRHLQRRDLERAEGRRRRIGVEVRAGDPHAPSRVHHSLQTDDLTQAHVPAVDRLRRHVGDRVEAAAARPHRIGVGLAAGVGELARAGAVDQVARLHARLQRRHQHERLERRPRLAGALHGEVVLVLGEPGPAHHRLHPAAGGIDGHDGRIGVGAGHQPPHHLVVGGLGLVLEDRVVGGVDPVPAVEEVVVALLVGVAQQRPALAVEQLLLHLFDEVVHGRDVGATEALRRQRQGGGGLHLSRGEPADVDQALEGDAPARRGAIREAEGVVGGGVADHAGQEGAVEQRELIDRLVEVHRRRGADAVGAVAEVHGVQVELEDLVLGQLLFEADGVHRLFHLAVGGLGVRQEVLLHHLLGDGGPALADLAGADVEQRGAHQAAEAHALVQVEALVLDGDHGLAHVGGDLLQRHLAAVDVALQLGQDVPVAVVHVRLAGQRAKRRDRRRRVVGGDELRDLRGGGDAHGGGADTGHHQHRGEAKERREDPHAATLPPVSRCSTVIPR